MAAYWYMDPNDKYKMIVQQSHLFFAIPKLGKMIIYI